MPLERNHGLSQPVQKVGGVIRLALYHNGIPYIEIPSATWKKWAGFGKSMKKSTKKKHSRLHCSR